jgi:hypothetical protein
MALEFTIEASETPATAQRLDEVHAAPGFGQVFTDHMVTARWTPDRGWHDVRAADAGPRDAHLPLRAVDLRRLQGLPAAGR